MTGTKSRAEGLTRILIGKNQFTENQGGLFQALLLNETILVRGNSVDGLAFNKNRQDEEALLDVAFSSQVAPFSAEPS